MIISALNYNVSYGVWRLALFVRRDVQKFHSSG